MSDKNDSTITQKYLDKILKMQQDREKATQEQYGLLTQQLAPEY